MRTIEERLKAFRKAANHADAIGWQSQAYDSAALESDKMLYAITKPWNAAVEAMKAVVKQSTITFPHTSVQECILCDRDITHGGHADSCAIPDIQVAIDNMESNSPPPSRDEAIVKDIRYEKNDIFKK